jgi:AcrR family transcriptional regulator
MGKVSYHHGDLRAAILAEAANLVAQRGAHGISLRELARAAGVSHAAPAHHFGDRRGLFTALAAEGFRTLTTELIDARPEFIDSAKAYVRFALAHPGHFEVMFDKSLYDAADVAVLQASTAAYVELNRGVGTLADPHAKADPDGAALAAWSLVHGFAQLWLNDAVDTAGDPIATIERLAAILFDG